MSLQSWADSYWLKPHTTSRGEIQNHLEMADRDIQDAQETGVSSDWRFGIAYNAALKLCTILLYCSGYKAARELAHYRTLKALPLILGSERNEDADYLDACRNKRNTVEYDYVGGATETNADELINFSKDLRDDVIAWLKENHPDFV